MEGSVPGPPWPHATTATIHTLAVRRDRVVTRRSSGHSSGPPASGPPGCTTVKGRFGSRPDYQIMELPLNKVWEAARS